MKNTHKKLAALNADSLRDLVNAVNEMELSKDDILGPPMYQDGSYCILYYQDCN